MTAPLPFSSGLDLTTVADHLPGLPAPAVVRQALTAEFNAAVQRERDRRGEVTRPSDVAPMVRAVEGFADLVDGYARVLSGVAKDARKIHEEELLSAVGEQDGIPAGRLKVTALDGTALTVKAKTSNEYDIDTDQVLGALIALVAARWERDPQQHHTPEDNPEGFAIEAGRRILALFGATPLKVTQVRALATELRQQGEDDLAQIVTDAERKRVIYRGVTVERKAAS